jgi:protein-S-isoprenylcysteine O-methyltransferase Ste14
MSRPAAISKTQEPIALPRSATHAVVAWIGVISMLGACALLNFWSPFQQYSPIERIAYEALFAMACTALGIFIPDLLWQKVQRRTLTSTLNAADLARVETKVVGLIASVGFIALIYWMAPEYHGGFYDKYYAALKVLWIPWAALSPFYIHWVDRRLAQPRDSLWQVGRLVLGQWHGLDARIIWQHLLGWLVKGFFLPLMFTYFCDNLDKLLHYNLSLLTSFKGCYDWSYFTLYFIDVALVSMTYLMSLKATDTQIRSTEPTSLGWLSALVCYQPFWSLLGRQYLDYDNGREWDLWLGNTLWLFRLWACLIIVLVIIYVWATVAFGARFSNLTHRGIITNGPYRFTKHPAYLSKNLSWWMLSMPFMVSSSLEDSVRRCAMLLSLNFIYYLRAKTEERHLSLDPVYVQYAKWIDQHGVLRGFNRIPLLGQLARWRPAFKAYVPPTPL